MNELEKNTKTKYNKYLINSLRKDKTPRSIGNLVRNQQSIDGDKEKKHILCSLVYNNSQLDKEDSIDYNEREI